VAQCDLIEREYRRHHEQRRGWGFVFCGPDRVPLFRDWVGGPGLRVLDLGCRDGALTSAYLSGNRVVGVDIDRVALDRAGGLGVDTVWADLDQPLPFENASFDVVVIAEVLEHLRLPEHVLSEALRVLVPGGALVGSVPNCYRLKSRLRFLLGRPPENDPTLLRMFRPADLTEALAEFEEVEVRFLAGRLVHLNARLFANDIAFRARTPQRVAPDRPPQAIQGHPSRCASTPTKKRPADRSRIPARLRTPLRTARGRAATITLLLMTVLLLVFAALPEALGDWPYNAFGH
jgi:SAM-dependent methyltransferase